MQRHAHQEPRRRSRPRAPADAAAGGTAAEAAATTPPPPPPPAQPGDDRGFVADVQIDCALEALPARRSPRRAREGTPTPRAPVANASIKLDANGKG